MVNDMEEVLTMLETREDYPCFVLDGQTSVLEDYFSVSPETGSGSGRWCRGEN